MDSMDADAKKNPLLRLFMRLKDVVQTLHNLMTTTQRTFGKRPERAPIDYLVFFDEFQKRVFTEKLPERKIIVRLPTNTVIEPTGDLPADTELEFTGGSFEVFKSPTGQDNQLEQFHRADCPRRYHNVMDRHHQIPGYYGETRRFR